MTQAVIHNMSGRVEKLREVAKMARDPEIAAIALKMAKDIEADILELTANATPTIAVGLPQPE